MFKIYLCVEVLAPTCKCIFDEIEASHGSEELKLPLKYMWNKIIGISYKQFNNRMN